MLKLEIIEKNATLSDRTGLMCDATQEHQMGKAESKIDPIVDGDGVAVQKHEIKSKDGVAVQKHEIKSKDGGAVVLFEAPTNCVATGSYIFVALTLLDVEFLNLNAPALPQCLNKKGQTIFSPFKDLVVVENKKRLVPSGYLSTIDRKIADAVFYIEVSWEFYPPRLDVSHRHIIVYADGCVFHSCFYRDHEGEAFGHGPLRFELKESDKVIFNKLGCDAAPVSDLIEPNEKDMAAFLEAFARLCLPRSLQTNFSNCSPRLTRCIRSWKNEGWQPVNEDHLISDATCHFMAVRRYPLRP